jgi:hypothetical protein
LPVPQSKVETEHGELYELGRNKTIKPNETSAYDQQRWYSEMIRYAGLRGYKKGWAYYAFQDKFKQKPPGWLSEIPSNMISPEVDSWIRARNIRNAKARAKMGFGRTA